MPKRHLTLVAYDISDNKARSHALKACKAFGLDGQKSVHECALTTAERAELEDRLSNLIDPTSDRLMLLRLDPRTKIRALTDRLPAHSPTLLYIG